MTRPAIALYQPDIPGNTGTILRLGACLGFDIHVIGPAGFDLSDKTLKRAGMDYLAIASLTDHVSWASFEEWRAAQGRRLILATTKDLMEHRSAICSLWDWRSRRSQRVCASTLQAETYVAAEGMSSICWMIRPSRLIFGVFASVRGAKASEKRVTDERQQRLDGRESPSDGSPVAPIRVAGVKEAGRGVSWGHLPSMPRPIWVMSIASGSSSWQYRYRVGYYRSHA